MEKEQVSFAVGEKKAYIPIVQGGMGVGISLHRLAGAVASEGGVGLISTAQIGFRENNFDSNPLQANLHAMGKELKYARKLAPNGIIGFNIMVATRHYEEYIKEAVRLGGRFDCFRGRIANRPPIIYERNEYKHCSYCINRKICSCYFEILG